MKAKLSKIDFQYFLYDNDDNLIGTTENSPYKRLSMENCQAIERGYDLDELADEWVFETNGHKWSNNDDTAGDNCSSFKAGFHIALELMVNKNFSEADIHEVYSLGEREDRSGFHGLLNSKQQTEWDVEIEMRSKDIDELRESNEGFLNNSNLYIPKLDSDGCLILKLKSE